MYNLYINTTGSQNKGTFKIDYRYKPLYFEEGSKIAFNNMLMYNSINNISSNLGNNVIYILTSLESLMHTFPWFLELCLNGACLV